MTSKQIVEQKLDDALYIDMPSTKFNPKLYNQDYSDNENFKNQLTHDEIFELLHLELDELKSHCEFKYAKCFLNDFKRERNHPDPDVHETYYDDLSPSHEYFEHLEDEIKKIEIKIDLIQEHYQEHHNLDNIRSVA